MTPLQLSWLLPLAVGSAFARAQLLQGWSCQISHCGLHFSCFIYCFCGAISQDLYLTLLCCVSAAVQVNLRWYKCGQSQNVGTDLSVVGTDCVSSCRDSARVFYFKQKPMRFAKVTCTFSSTSQIKSMIVVTGGLCHPF